MGEIALSTSGAMEGQGAYNRHAKIQAGGAALALPYWEKAVLSVPLAHAHRPIVLADYGSSQGRNSFAPLRLAIRTLRSRLSADHPILVYHIDLPTNDFNALFEELETDPGRYAGGDPNVFPCAVGRSFYGSVLPPGHVDLGWCSYAAQWFSRIPALIPGHIYAARTTGAIRAEFERQSARDWERFLELRSAELRPAGHLVVVGPAANENGCSGFEGIMDDANAVLAAMVDEHAITADERAHMVIATGPRSKTDLLAPFARDGRFQGLTVQHCDIVGAEDIAWADYQHDGDREALGRSRASFFRSTFAPTLACALAAHRDPGSAHAFSERLEQGLRERVASHPAPINHLVGTIVLAKQ